MRSSMLSPPEVELEIKKRLARAELQRRGKPFVPAPLPPNPYQQSFLRFLSDCIWTYDEARAGQVREWPSGADWDPLWRDWETALLCCSPLLIDKTRRVMASHIVCAFDLWLCLGGQDPRWPELLLSSSNRKVLIQAKKLEGDTGAMEFVARIAKGYKLAVANGLKQRWPSLPDMDASLTKIAFSNGSTIEALPQGADQIRGPGATLIHMEELGVMEQAQQSIGSALPALSGTGHLVAVTTPNADSYAKRIRNGEI